MSKKRKWVLPQELKADKTYYLPYTGPTGHRIGKFRYTGGTVNGKHVFIATADHTAVLTTMMEPDGYIYLPGYGVRVRLFSNYWYAYAFTLRCKEGLECFYAPR